MSAPERSVRSSGSAYNSPVPRASSPGKSRIVLIVAAVVAGMAVFGCGVGTLIYFVFVHEFQETVTPADRDVLFTVDTLAAFADVAMDPGLAKARRVRHLDGSREVTYEYESPDGAGDPLYLSSSVNIERSLSDARTVYLGATIGLKLGLALEGDTSLRQVVRPGLLQWGDESRAVLLVKGDKPVGNVFAGRKGRKVFLVVLVGVFFDEHEQVEAALGPILKRFEAYNP
jgi:hypothetical protein